MMSHIHPYPGIQKGQLKVSIEYPDSDIKKRCKTYKLPQNGSIVVPLGKTVIQLLFLSSDCWLSGLIDRDF